MYRDVTPTLGGTLIVPDRPSAKKKKKKHNFLSLLKLVEFSLVFLFVVMMVLYISRVFVLASAITC